MSKEDFKALKFGNVVKGDWGQYLVVTNIIRDENNEVKYIGFVPAVSIDDEKLCGLEVVSKATVETLLLGRTVQS